MVLYSPGPIGRAVLVPLAFALGSMAITNCEDRGRQAWDAVGLLGEKGPWQIHVRLHGPRMRALGLDPDSETARIQFAVVLWQERGETFQAWSCWRNTE